MINELFFYEFRAHPEQMRWSPCFFKLFQHAMPSFSLYKFPVKPDLLRRVMVWRGKGVVLEALLIDSYAKWCSYLVLSTVTFPDAAGYVKVDGASVLVAKQLLYVPRFLSGHLGFFCKGNACCMGGRVSC